MTIQSLSRTIGLLLASGVVVACGAPAASVSADLEDGEWLPGGDTTNTLLFGTNAFSRPADNITEEHETQFYSGNAFFNDPWVQAPSSTMSRDGLGPLFNARSCAACHFKDGRGRPPLEEGEEFIGVLFRLRVGFSDEGEPLPHEKYGGQIQPFSIPDVAPEGTPRVTYEEMSGKYPDGATYSLSAPAYTIESLAYGPLDDGAELSPRAAQAMIGLGLLEAIPADRLEELADPEDADADGVSGRIRRVRDASSGEVTVGRFGWKAEQPSVRQQAAGAFLGDIGITSALFPEGECTEFEEDCQAAPRGGEPELEAKILDRVSLYSRLLAVPTRLNYDDETVLWGKALFDEVGCSSCHVARHRTAHDAALEEVRDQVIWPYTDLLLHDMGVELADGSGELRIDREWRTPPLWGLSHYESVGGHERLLHDGRARGVEEAILWHGGEAEGARDRFRELDAEERAALIEFVRSL